MDAIVESGDKPGSISQETARPSNLDEGYIALEKIFARCDGLIPQEGLQIRSKNGVITAKAKQLNPSQSLSHLQQVLQERFDPEEQRAIIEATSDFIDGIVSNITPYQSIRDAIPLGQIDLFLAGFPDNIIVGLGNFATAAAIVNTLQIGNRAISHYAERSSVARPDPYHNFSFGVITDLVAGKIPQVLARAQERNMPGVFDKLWRYASELSNLDLENLIDYYSTLPQLSPEAKAAIAQLETAVQRIDPSMGATPSPFNQPDREPWRQEAVMGEEKRNPTWGDLGSMVRCTEEDDIEYGFKVAYSPANQNTTVLEFIRGDNQNIKNKGNRKGTIFFHSHPSDTSKNALTSQLVSDNDITATSITDYGGGYLNIACGNGVTLNLGAELIDEKTDTELLAEAEEMAYVFVAESGHAKGARFRSGDKSSENTRHIMRQLNESGQPYVISVINTFNKSRTYFIHIPWGSIDKSIELSDVLFGEGLEKLLSGINDLPDIPRSKNLVEALKSSKATYLRSLLENNTQPS